MDENRTNILAVSHACLMADWYYHVVCERDSEKERQEDGNESSSYVKFLYPITRWLLMLTPVYSRYSVMRIYF